MAVQAFDLVVIGAGPAGICGANTAGIFGKRVALVEKLREVGGAGINSGTIPSKTLRETALALSGLRSRNLFGVDLSLRREATVADFMRHKETVATKERQFREGQLRTNRVETFMGRQVSSIPIRYASARTRFCAAKKFLSPLVRRPRVRRNFSSNILECMIRTNS
jgi:pyruvate/2-oxoglutarate dehydrogenase complex dihydrolipoamide dehydrogenase (E3) component